ncbi:MAG: glycosyltransferase family 9 protein [Bacteroidetes bacterium]|nr:glycosyltransferase family 9 protein [Bacteroidota bacterium]
MKFIELFVKKILLNIVSFFFSPFPIKNLNLDTIKRILIIRQHDQLGDLLLTTPAIRALRKKYPNAFISILVREYTEPVIKLNPHLNKIIIFREKINRWSFKYAIKLWKDIRENYDTVILLNTISRSVSSDIISLLAKPKIILGPNIPILRKTKNELIYNLLSENSEKHIHQINLNLEILKPLKVIPNGREYDLILSENEIEEGNTIFKNLIGKNKKKLIGVHFGTLDISRRLPLDKLAAAINYILTKKKYLFILIVSKNEIELLNEMNKSLNTKILVAPLMPLRVFSAFIKNLDLFLCNDTGTLHIASSQRIPTLSFHAKNDPKEWKPINKRHIALRANDHLITSITVDQIINGIEKAAK